MTTTPLDVLLVEDNPGDARLIEEMLEKHDVADGHPASLERPTASSGGASHEALASSSGIGRPPSLTHVTTLEAGLEELSKSGGRSPDVVLLDLGLPDSRGMETLETVSERTESFPIVVLTGLQDQQYGVEALERGAHEYLVKGEITSDLLVRSLYHALERAQFEARLAAQHDRLETMNQLNALVQDVTQTLIDRATREEIEQTVCEQLAGSVLYEAAWVGEVTTERDAATLRASAGLGDGLEVEDLGASLATETTTKAIATHEIQVDHAADGDAFVSEGLVRGDDPAVAAVPLVYEQTFYGLLSVYAARSNAFDEREQTMLGRLGEVIAHTVNAVETKRRLFADTVVELEFESTDRELFFIDASDRLDCVFSLDRIVPTTEGSLFYITVTGADTDAVIDFASGRDVIEGVRLVTERSADECVFEFRVTGASVSRTLTQAGAKVTTATADAAAASYVAEVGPQTSVRSVVDAVESAHPNIRFVARREVTKTPNRNQRGVFEDLLTDRQRGAVQAAYHAGFFDWPRESTGEEVADSLGVSAPTFHQHLRTAHQKMLGELLDGRARDDRAAGRE